MNRLLLCAVLMLASPSGATAATSHTIDLATGNVDGHRILGRTLAGVTSALGRPHYHSGPRSHYTLGWGRRPSFSVEVFFRPAGGIERAWSMAFEQHVRDVKVGDLLGRSSASLQAAVRKTYGDTFTLVRPYTCKAGRCVGELAARDGTLHVGFGTRASTGTWLTVWRSLG